MNVNMWGSLTFMTTRTDLSLSPATAEPCCAAVFGDAVDEGTARGLATVFKALSDPNRVRLVSLIAAADGAEACVCDLTERVGLSQPTVSHHMKVLVEAGLIAREQRGRWAYFRVEESAFAAVREALSF